MGLGALRKRTKLSHDPNNTAWSRSSERYGHKIMLSQGWTPGSSLGINDGVDQSSAPAVNAPTTKAKLRVDNRGMGVMHGENNGEGQCTGLDVFQGILGRLNGKPEAELEMEQRSRKYVTLQKGRWELSCFVSGGYLDGQNPRESSQNSVQKVLFPSGNGFQATEHDTSQATRTPVKNDNSNAEQNISTIHKRRRHRSTGSKGNEAIIDGPRQILFAESPISTTTLPMATRSITPTITATASIDAHEAQLRLQKANRKLDRNLKKVNEKVPGIELSQERSAPQIPSTYTDGHVTESPLASSQPSPGIGQPMIGRHLARQRYIRQKKMATIDSKALNEILMIKG